MKYKTYFGKTLNDWIVELCKLIILFVLATLFVGFFFISTVFFFSL